MKKQGYSKIFNKPYYWRYLNVISQEFRVDNELLEEFIESLYSYIIVSDISSREFRKFDLFELDSYLSSLSDVIVEDYNSNENDYDYKDYFESFVTTVLWEKWFKGFIDTIMDEFDSNDGILEKVKIKHNTLEIDYLEK